MVRKLLQTVMVVLLVLFLVSTVALAAEMTCTGFAQKVRSEI